MLRLYPNYTEMQSGLHRRLFFLLHDVGRDSEAVAELLKSLDEPKAAPLVARIKASRDGFTDVVRIYVQDPIIAEWESHWNLALFQALLGDREQTLNHLQQAYANHENEASLLNADSHFDFVRDDPRFNALLAKMNLNATR